MKLLRLKITDPAGFRSLQPDFEHHFRTQWDLHNENGFAPFVCAGPNGHGKSNLLEVLAAIFFNIETRCLDYLPESQGMDNDAMPIKLLPSDKASPDGYELEYLTPAETYDSPSEILTAHVLLKKIPGQSPDVIWLNGDEFGMEKGERIQRSEIHRLLPDFILGYSSGENEVLSLPFFKMRFVQFDEYWHALKNQLSYSGRPEARLVYLDSGFSQAISLCNLLFDDADALELLQKDVGIEDLKEFRIIVRRSIGVSPDVAEVFGKNNPALIIEEETGRHTVNLIKLLEAGIDSAKNFDPIITRLMRCATCTFLDEATDILYFDYFVNDATKKAFKENFDFEVNKSPISLFQALQVLLTLNLYSVSDFLKADLYQSDSLYVKSSVPILASDERIMRFKNFWLKKAEIDEPVLLKSLSDGEHQLLHSLGLCLLFKNTNSLFLLDEPETHFNPDWRSNFASRLNQCLKNSKNTPEVFVTTHTPFLISDSKPEKVLVFKKDKEKGTVSISKPDYNTLGASINKITMKTFGKRETIGGRAQAILEFFRSRFENGEDKEQLITEIDERLGDSVEKVMLIKTILDSMETKD